MQSIGQRLPKSRPIEGNPTEISSASSPSNWLYGDKNLASSTSIRRESLYPAELSGLEAQA
jgi:hypothetical protein